MNEKFAWYVSRSSGWVAFVLLAVTVIWGILGITKVIERKGLPRWMMDLHKYLALLTVVFTGVHLGGLVADNFVHIGWREILVPYALDWKPGAVTLGIVAFYLLLVVQVSSWLKSCMPRRLWKSLHMLSYPAMWLVAMHGLRAGSDASYIGVRIGVTVIVIATSFFTLLRILRGRTARRAPVPTIVEPIDPATAATTAATAAPAPAPVAVAIDQAARAHLDRVHAVKESLQDALDQMHGTRSVQLAPPVTGPPVERRQGGRTLVGDVPPPS